MPQSSNRKPAKSTPGMTAVEQGLVDSLIEKRTTMPNRITAELERVHDGLKKLVEAKVPISDILNVFIKSLSVRVTSGQARTYLREQFDYPAKRTNTPRASSRSSASKASAPRKAAKSKAN